MQTLIWNTDTRTVSVSALSRATAQVSSVRGDASTETINLIVVNGTPAAPYLPDASLSMGIVIRPPLNLKQGVLNGALTVTRGANAALGYTIALSTDTELTRSLMHVDDSDPATEAPTFAATAVAYLVPATGTDAIESLPFNWNVQANYYRPLQPPADVVETYPPADQMDTIDARDLAIAQAVAATATRNDYRLVAAIQKADSMAALRALPEPTATDSGQVDLRGYYAPGDGGGGSFYWDPAYTFLQPLTVTLGAAGSGYHVHDLLQLGGGTAFSAALVDVLSVDANGAILTFAVLPGSSYGALPVGAQATTVFHAEGAAHAPAGATFAVATSSFDDGGACVCPTGYTGAGRWRRMLGENLARNVLWWGAQFANVYGADVDSYDAINAAIASLPNGDFSAQDYPGAGRTGHQKRGEIYFPPDPLDPANFGFEVRDEIYVSCTMSLRGEINKSRVAFVGNVAPSTAQEKWVIRCLYSGSSNESFYTDIIGLVANGRRHAGNPGASGIYYIGCNGGRLIDCVVNEVGLRGYYVDSAGCYLNNLRTDDVLRGPGLTVTGQQVVAGYLDIEHVNYAQALGGASTTIYYDPSDGNNDPYPAVLLNCSSSHFALITTEESPLSIKFSTAPNTTVATLHANTSDYLRTQQASPLTASLVKAYNSDHISVVDIEEQGNAQWANFVIDNNNGFGTFLYPGDGIGARGSYIQREHISSLDVSQLLVYSSTFKGGPVFRSVDQGAADQITWQGSQGQWNFLRQGGAGGAASHPVFGIDQFDRPTAPAGFVSSIYYFNDAPYSATLSIDPATHALRFNTNMDGISKRVLTDNGNGNRVATNAAKLALPASTPVGSIWTITGEGNRVECFTGGDITQNANWGVLKNTVLLTVENDSGADLTVNGIDCPAGATVNLGWLDPENLQMGGSINAGIYFYCYNGYGTGSDSTLSQDICDGPLACSFYPARCGDAYLAFTSGSGF